jgi:hypothetical protein
MLASDELIAVAPATEIKTGATIEILQNGKDEKTGWISARVGGRFTVGGLTRLILEAVNE